MKPSLPYSYSEIGSKIFYRCFEVDDVRVSPQANPSRPPRGKKSSYTRTDLHLTLPPGGQTRSSLAGGSQPIALPCRSKAAATDQEAGHYRPRAPPQERQHPMLSRRLLLGLPSRLPENRCILVQSTSKAGGQVLITSSVLRPTVPWDCCWDRNWQFCTDGYLREGRISAFSPLPSPHSGTLSGFSTA